MVQDVAHGRWDFQSRSLWWLRDRLERLAARLVGVENIRETTLFPRDLHRPEP